MGRISVGVPAGGAAVVGALEWAPTGEVRGVANDASGNPVASALLFVMEPQRKQRRLAAMQFLQMNTGHVSVLTDRQGRYRIPYTPAGEWILVTRPDQARGGVATNLVEVTVEEHKVTTVDLSIDR